MHRCCEDLDTHFPENSMPYFLSGDLNTWVINPNKLSKFAPAPTPMGKLPGGHHAVDHGMLPSLPDGPVDSEL
ncbi:hypothetical protein C0993_006139 [Termitomyces sp. T159_Od127]|nr:hypothetical protein C0993_006139 [Termitomyces sp. T159_Od127]